MVDRVFISYAQRDSGIAERLVDALQSVGLSVWLDRESLAPGTLITEEISQAIQSADAVLVLVTENSLASAWVQREIELAATSADFHAANSTLSTGPRHARCRGIRPAGRLGPVL